MTVETIDADDDWKFPLLLSYLAGGSTCLGAAIVFCFESSAIQQSMPFSPSLAASVMITVSVISIGPECLEHVIEYQDAHHVLVDFYLLLERLISFGLGCLGYWLLSRVLILLPKPESILVSKKQADNKDDEDEKILHPHQILIIPKENNTDNNRRTTPTKQNSTSSRMRRNNNTREEPSTLMATLPSSISLESFKDDEEIDDSNAKLKSKLGYSHLESESKRRSWRVAMLLFVSLLLHNFPEGLAVAVSTVESRELGVTVAIGILVHNIPEGIAIAVPCLAARPGQPWLALLASASGLAEPLGAIFALCVLHSSKERSPLENVLACVAGIMRMLAVVELYPEALRHLPMSPTNKDESPSSSSQRQAWHCQKFVSIIVGTIVGVVITLVTEWYLSSS